MRRLSLLLAPVVIASLMLCAGCVKLNMAVAVAPDRSTSARLTAAIDTSLAEMAQGAEIQGPFADLKEKSGGKWQTRQYKEGNWIVQEATGQAGPGEALFPENAEGETPKLQVQTSQRRLSTRYNISMIVPAPPQEALTPPAEEQPKAGEDGNAEMGQAFAGLAAGLMAEMAFNVSLTGPGEVVATTGTVAGPGKAEWKLSLTELQEKKVLPDFRVTTEIPNWDTIGKLANQMVLRGGPYDAGSRIAMALQRGLLPNPPMSVAAAEKLSAVDYLRLVEIIQKLDAAAGPTVTDVIVKQSRLDDEDATSDRIAAVHDRIMKMDVGQVVEQATIQGISKGLQ